MLFLLKRMAWSALTALIGMAMLGETIRRSFQTGAEFGFSVKATILGIAVFGIVLLSDASLHGVLCLLFGDWYRGRHRELATAFKGQTFAGMFTGALMAGCGEELIFRGLSTSLFYLVAAAIVFGLLHHIRFDLWPFTAWAIWQGLLFAAALYVTEMLFVTMVAHFLHDLAGFLIFRYFNRPLPVGMNK